MVSIKVFMKEVLLKISLCPIMLGFHKSSHMLQTCATHSYVNNES